MEEIPPTAPDHDQWGNPMEESIWIGLRAAVHRKCGLVGGYGGMYLTGKELHSPLNGQSLSGDRSVDSQRFMPRFPHLQVMTWANSHHFWILLRVATLRWKSSA